MRRRSSDRRRTNPADRLLGDARVLARLGDSFRRGFKSDFTVRAVAKRLVDGTAAPAQRDARPARGNRDRLSIGIGQRDRSRDKVRTVGQNFDRYIIHAGIYAIHRTGARPSARL